MLLLTFEKILECCWGTGWVHIIHVVYIIIHIIITHNILIDPKQCPSSRIPCRPHIINPIINT